MERKNYYQTLYIEGNTVRKQQAAPEYDVPRKSKEQIAREKARRQAAKRNQRHAMAINPGYVVFLTVAAVICFAVAGMFIHLQSNITTHLSQIAALETQISDLKADNSAMQNRLEITMTLEEVKEKAAAMGLVYPESDQLRHYTVESVDYMSQYSEVDVH